MKRNFWKPSWFLMCGALITFTAACSTTTGYESANGDAVEISDPFEDTNRIVFGFNAAMDDAFINPVVLGYREVVPAVGRQGIQNFLTNLKSPLHLANEVLQGDLDGAGNVIFRTTVNTLAGFGGVVDVATQEGYEAQPEDFGQTLGVWGVDHGPYLVLPLLGPSSLRDYTGYFVDAFADPVRIYLHNEDRMHTYYAMSGLHILSLRDDLLDVLTDLQASSIDYYASVRSTYYQRREALLNDEDPEAAQTPDIPDYDE